MNGFMKRPLAVAAALAALAPAGAVGASEIAKTVRVTLTILPGAQTHFEPRNPAGSRFAVTDDGGLPVDLRDVHVYVREAGADRRYTDSRSAEAAIVAAQRTSEGPVFVTLVF